MKLWQQLYGMIWLVFLTIVIRFPAELHLILGIAVLALALSSSAKLRTLSVPDRLKRITRSTAQLSGAQIVLGVLLYAAFRFGFVLIPANILGLLHLVVALAIITQASSVATAYDMWEEREYEVPTVPAAVPA